VAAEKKSDDVFEEIERNNEDKMKK